MSGGTTFRRHYVTTPICCPSRVSILSGRYAHNAGAVSDQPSGWCGVGTYWKAPLQNLSLPTYIRDAGLSTGIFGCVSAINCCTFARWNAFVTACSVHGSFAEKNSTSTTTRTFPPGGTGFLFLVAPRKVTTTEIGTTTRGNGTRLSMENT